MKPISLKFYDRKTLLAFFATAWTTLGVNAHSVLSQHGQQNWAMAIVLGALLTIGLLVALVMFGASEKIFKRRTGFVWSLLIMPISTFMFCYVLMQVLWVVAPFLHAS
jgi:hypothetical protein